MSRGQFQPNGHTGKVLRGCKNKEHVSKVPIIDVDDGGKVEFVTFDSAESSHARSTWFRKSRLKGKTPICDLIDIDEENNDSGNKEECSESSDGTHFFYVMDDEEFVVFIEERKTPPEDPLKKENIGACSKIIPDSERVRENGMPVRESFDLSSSENDMSDEVDTGVSDNESSDCEIVEDSLGNFREEWQRAASKKRIQEGMQNASNSHPNTSESSSASESEFYGVFQEGNVRDDVQKSYSNGSQFVDKSFHFYPVTGNDQAPPCKIGESRGDPYPLQKESSVFPDCVPESLYQGTDELNFRKPISKGADTCGREHKQSFVSSNATELDRMNISGDKESGKPRVDIQKLSPENISSHILVSRSKFISNHLNLEDVDSRSQIPLISDREKHKSSDEYKRAAEEEWAARKEQLRIQAEEARRQRKKKKAESLRLLDMERRQKERLAEVRESQRKNEETLNLKEQLRIEVRKQLDLMELKHQDMASLLRALGIQVGGGGFPVRHEINAAYKQALLRFHPDRASRTDIRQQVEAEEKFKLVSRLKEKFLQ